VLAACAYPRVTKARIYDHHLSNDQVAEFIEHTMFDSVRTLILGHISNNANSVELARLSAQLVLQRSRRLAQLVVAEPGQAVMAR
jgi:phosphoribosyl 1,2-cyclic phosphodiesterase